MANKRKTNGTYRKFLLWATGLLEGYTNNTLDEETLRQVEEWQPEDIPVRFDLPDELLDHGCERVGENVFSRLGFEKKVSKEKRLIPIMWYKYAVVAALLIISTCTVFFVSQNNDIFEKALSMVEKENWEMLVAGQNILQVTLPDGTVLHINRGSKLSYNKNRFNKENREVWLEGEAFFDVAKNPDKLFIIHNDDLHTIVRGTSFNIKAYGELDETSITVRTGTVEIRENDSTLMQLIANEQLCYTKSKKKIQKFSADWHDASAWMQGKLVLRNAGMDELLLRIRQLYNKEVILDNHILQNERLVISFEKETGFSGVMDAICALYDVKYKETGANTVTIYR